jgi:TolA-binding protein
MFRQGDLESAARGFEEILRARPKHEKARIFLALTHSQTRRNGVPVPVRLMIDVAFRLF